MLKFNHDILFDAIMREYKCDKKKALRYIDNIKGFSDKLQPVLDAWIYDGSIIDFSVNDVDIHYIMQKMRTHFLAAIMHMNRFILDPEEAQRFKNMKIMIKDAYPFGGVKNE